MQRTARALVCFLAAMVIAAPVLADRDYTGRPGYKERPYDKHRHYKHHKHHDHQYTYRGHWRSWREWDDYARHHPRMYKYGRYYRDEGHLMFRICDPDSGGCFFFSIGR